jgi:uncharacterized protein YjbI with pentapeptide repeats
MAQTPQPASPTTNPLAPRFVGKTFKLTGMLFHDFKERIPRLIAAEGGRVVPDITETLDFLVESRYSDRTSRADRKKVAELSKSAGVAIRVLTEDQFNKLFFPDQALALALLRSGPAGVERFNLLRGAPHFSLDLGGADLRDLALAGVNFREVNLDGADLRGADLSGAFLPPLAGARLDGANLRQANNVRFRDCSLRNANLTRAYHGGQVQPLERCDFTGANLTEATLCGYVPTEVVFHQANLEGVNWNAGHLPGADFRGLNLARASFARADLTGAQLAGARLEEASLLTANLTGADLTGADLRRAILIDANLSQATVDGADFAGANLIGADLTGVDIGKAHGLDSTRTVPTGQVGPHIREWEKLAAGARWLNTTARIALPDGRFAQLSIHASGTGSHVYTSSGVSGPSFARFGYSVNSRTVSAAFVDLPRRWADGSLQLESITVEGKGVALRGKALTQAAIRAWCEGCGVPVPSADDHKVLEQKIKAEKQGLHEQMLADLRGGPEGVKRWNARGKEDREKAGHFRKADLAGARLDEVRFGQIDFTGANLAGASLRQATFYRAKFPEASFKGACCQEATLSGGNFRSADFEGADLRQAKLGRARLGKANLKGADLTGAQLHKADLCGAVLTNANLTDAAFDQARFDGATVFPAGFTPPRAMRWVGKGPDPRSAATPAPTPGAAVAGALEVEGLLKRLQQSTPSGRLANALAMLKADRFRLFSQVDSAVLAGVVKSQTDASLVYSCRLGHDGSFSCCTQNLRPCGGLQGALCKHLLVLIVGLARSGQLDPATVDAWAQASRTQKPALDKEAASAVFLRYKGAEAGEIDWRPTETIPEDYYSF